MIRPRAAAAVSVLSCLVAVLAACAAGTKAPAEPLYTAAVLTEAGAFTRGIEGPAVGADGTLYAVNFERGGTIGQVPPGGAPGLFVALPEGSTGNGLRFAPDGDLRVADYTGHNILRVDMETKAVSVVAHEPRMSQPNDIAIDAQGRLYASDPNWRRGTGQLWRIDPDGAVTLLADGQGTTNGIEVSPDGQRLYVGESAQRTVFVWDLTAAGTIANKRPLIAFADHGLDGMRCDTEGNLYITRHGAGTVVKVSPAGEVLQEVALAGSQPSNIAFGGADGRTAYVTLQDKGHVETFRVAAPGREFRQFAE